MKIILNICKHLFLFSGVVGLVFKKHIFRRAAEQCYKSQDVLQIHQQSQKLHFENSKTSFKH